MSGRADADFFLTSNNPSAGTWKTRASIGKQQVLQHGGGLAIEATFLVAAPSRPARAAALLDGE